jgi:uncharacterized surface protein with fasciclin (FAS1) repeats
MCLQAAGLAETLSDPEAVLTVFAPTNDAFDKAFAELGNTADQLLESPAILGQVSAFPSGCQGSRFAVQQQNVSRGSNLRL